MSRSVFGWDLPPGCTHRMIDEQFGGDAQCIVCKRHCDDCMCPECPHCGQHGDPACYEADGWLVDDQVNAQLADHPTLLKLSHEQKVSRAKYEVEQKRHELFESELALHYLECNKEENVDES